jgi:hypothetical protein
MKAKLLGGKNLMKRKAKPLEGEILMKKESNHQNLTFQKFCFHFPSKSYLPKVLLSFFIKILPPKSFAFIFHKMFPSNSIAFLPDKERKAKLLEGKILMEKENKTFGR